MFDILLFFQLLSHNEVIKEDHNFDPNARVKNDFFSLPALCLMFIRCFSNCENSSFILEQKPLSHLDIQLSREIHHL